MYEAICVLSLVVVFFFKQKTAYEIRKGDWSSDVCSSDLALQVSSPVERGIGIDISRLAVESSDPALRLVDVAGRLHVIGDSLEFDLSRVKFPGSALRAARGRVSWPRGPLLFDLSLHADSATLGDFHFIDRRFAPGAVLAGGVRLRSHGGRVVEVGLNPLRLRQGGGR